MNQTRRQHYVPAFYLAQFAEPTERLGRLCVYDRATGRQYGSSPDGAAHQRDFYRVDSMEPGNENVVETTFDRLEAQWAPLVHSVNAEGRLPKADDLGLLLALVAFQAVRVPAVRGKMQNLHSDVMMRMLEVSASDRQVLENLVRRTEPAVTDEELDELHGEIKAFLAAPGARITFDRTTLVSQALELAPTIGKALAQRYWSLGMASSDIALVTTDNPVTFDWALQGAPPPGWSPGFGRQDTMVVFPLGPQIVLLGTPYPLENDRLQLSRESTARLNSIIAIQADQRVFFGGENFHHLRHDGAIVEGPTDELLLRRGSKR